jgi:hypothetical protein
MSILGRDCDGLSTYSLSGSSAHIDALKEEEKHKASHKQIDSHKQDNGKAPVK